MLMENLALCKEKKNLNWRQGATFEDPEITCGLNVFTNTKMRVLFPNETRSPLAPRIDKCHNNTRILPRHLPPGALLPAVYWRLHL